MEKTDKQLVTLLKPFINNTVLIMDGDKYILRIKEASLSDYVEPYENVLEHEAMVRFDVYKNQISDDNYIDNEYIRMNVWRKDLNSDFFTSAKSDRTGMSYKARIFSKLTYMLFDNDYKDIRDKDRESHSVSGHGSYNEDNIEYNKYGQIIKKGDVEYYSIDYGKGLSMKYTTKYYIEDFKKYHEMNVKVEKIQGDYHPLWYLKSEGLEDISFHYRGNYKDKKIIYSKDTIEKVVKYIKSLSFEEVDKDTGNYEPYIYLKLDEPLVNVTLGKDYIYINSADAYCKGEEYVKKLIDILESAG